jgi:hypothetical protein
VAPLPPRLRFQKESQKTGYLYVRYRVVFLSSIMSVKRTKKVWMVANCKKRQKRGLAKYLHELISIQTQQAYLFEAALVHLVNEICLDHPICLTHVRLSVGK